MRSVQVNNLVKGFRVRKPAVTRLFSALDGCPVGRIGPGELSVVFLDDAAMCQLHAEFLDDPTPTDVITFPGETEDDGTGVRFAGEICVDAEQARREAGKHNNTMGDEVLLYLVHGWLHLAGFDDREEKARKKMRQAEQAVLAYLRRVSFAGLGIANSP